MVSKKFFKRDFARFSLTLAVLFIAIFFIHEFGHIVVQLFLGIPVSIGFSLEKISTMASINLLDYPFPVAFTLLISGFAASIIPISYLRKIVFVPKKIKEKINPEKFTFDAYLALCVSLALWDFWVILILFLR